MGDQKIKNKLLYYKTKSQFASDLQAGKIFSDSIAFIEDTKEIWTHGQFFISSGGLPDNIEQLINTAVNNKIQDLNENPSLNWNNG